MGEPLGGMMYRRPVAAVTAFGGALHVVCNDGAVFVATWTADGQLHDWLELEPIPGTERVATRSVSPREKWPGRRGDT